MIGRSIEVLLVEDNLGDAELTKLALEESQLSINLSKFFWLKITLAMCCYSRKLWQRLPLSN